jgi:two-component system LytT family response regulator
VVVSPGAGARLFLRDGRRTHLIPVSGVLWVESYGNYARVYTAAARYLHRVTIARLADALAPYGFRRIHRKIIVNGARALAIRPRGGEREVLLDTGHRVPVGRTYRAAADALR